MASPPKKAGRFGERVLLAAAWTIAGSVIVLLFLAGRHRPASQPLWGDEGTYVAMTESLVLDHDLRFTEADRLRALPDDGEPPRTVILQRTRSGIGYSKSALYPLLAAPFYALFGERGLLLCNAAFLIVALLLAWAYLQRCGSASHATLAVLTFAAAGVLPLYVGWKMSESLQVALALLGMTLALGRLRANGTFLGPWALYLGGTALGLLASMRPPQALLLLGVLAAYWTQREWRAGALVAGAAILAFLAAGGLNLWLTGAQSPYRAERSSFNLDTGYPVGPGADTALRRFDERAATHQSLSERNFDLEQSLYSGIYFFIGRHSGVLWYFPAALVLLLCALRKPDGTVLSLLATAAAISAFYVIWMPMNYFGGSTFIGNRYFLVAYPILLVATRRLPSPRQWSIAWLLALAVGGSALLSVQATTGLTSTTGSQRHASAGLFRWLPHESTAQQIDDHWIRYWAGDFVRFVDPFAEVGPVSFNLSADQPAAELEIATTWSGSPLKFLVTAASLPATLEFRDWGSHQTVPLILSAEQPSQVIEFSPSVAWRRHRFWWQVRQPYSVRTLRIALRSSGARSATATLRYLGDGRKINQRPATEATDP